MKICKNCGKQTDDNRVRCPYCGFLFEEDMDAVLGEMRSNLSQYRNELATRAQAQPAAAAQTAPQPQTVPAAPQPAAAEQGAVAAVQTLQPAADAHLPETRERFELLSEVAQLKGEVRVLQGEIERLHESARQNPQVPPVSVVYTQQGGGTAQVPGVVYAPGPAGQQQVAAVAVKSGGKEKKKRSANRIVLSVLCILLLGASIGMFWMAWIETEGMNFKGFDAFRYLFGEREGTVFGTYMTFIREIKEFKGASAIANICRNLCYYGVRYGIIVYAGFLVLSVLQLFSLGGRISMRGWHRFTAWMSFIIALALFGILCWVSGFSALTMWFLLGAGANLVRAFFLIFYKKDKFTEGGLQ